MATKSKKATGFYTRSREFLGKPAIVEFFRHSPDEKIEVKMKILDYKVSYGKERFLVEPHAGQGKVWVEKPNLRLIKA